MKTMILSCTDGIYGLQPKKSKFCVKYLHKLGDYGKSPYLSTIYTFIDSLYIILIGMAKIAFTDP